MKTHNILLIEDDLALGEILRHRLQQEGHTVTWHRDGLLGFQAIFSVKPDLLITDISVPTISGMEIIMQKNKDPMIASIPVLVLSNSFIPKDSKQMEGLGVAAFLIKAQLTPTDIITTIHNVMEPNNTDTNTTQNNSSEMPSQPIASGIPHPEVAIESIDLHGKHILLVEDDAFLHSILAKRFESEGAIIIHAVTGEEALAAVKDSKIDLAILDVLLPGVNGFEVLHAIRADQTLQNIPVIMVSNFSQPDDMQKAQQAGAHYLVKALVSPDEIVTKIKEVIGGQLI